MNFLSFNSLSSLIFLSKLSSKHIPKNELLSCSYKLFDISHDGSKNIDPSLTLTYAALFFSKNYCNKLLNNAIYVLLLGSNTTRHSIFLFIASS